MILYPQFELAPSYIRQGMPGSLKTAGRGEFIQFKPLRMVRMEIMRQVLCIHPHETKERLFNFMPPENHSFPDSQEREADYLKAWKSRKRWELFIQLSIALLFALLTAAVVPMLIR
jgi:hypothetical protein